MGHVEFDPKQKEAIAAIHDWYLNESTVKPYFVLAGRAGTGKSTITQEAVSILGIPFESIAFAAPTGKAAEVMHKKGNLGAKTLHGLIYRYIYSEDLSSPKTTTGGEMSDVIEKLSRNETVDSGDIVSKINQARAREAAGASKQKMHFAKRDVLEKDYKLIVIDEASMINDKQIEELESFKIPVLYIGDHHQLKPVEGFNSRISNPDFTLEKIHRQGGESGILTLADEILEQGKGYIPRYMKNMPDVIFMQFDFLLSHFEKYGLTFPDQLLCATNKMRCMLNAYIRKLLGYTTPFPEVGDKLICTKNNWDLGIYNGMQCSVVGVKGIYECIIVLDILPFESNIPLEVTIDKSVFLPSSSAIKDKDLDQFDFGYAVTVHKAQGSEWNNVVYIESFFGEETRRLNYTAVTRAKEKLVVVPAPSKEDQEIFLSMI